MKRKTRVSKKAVRAIQDYNKKTSYERKKIIVPGPYTNIETSLILDISLHLTNSVAFTKPIYGTYCSIEWNEKGWYPITMNVKVENLDTILTTTDINTILAALEKALTAKKIYGHVIVLNYILKTPIISITAKTNKKSIPNFAAVRQGKYIILEENEAA